jgi:hypothetical protein
MPNPWMMATGKAKAPMNSNAHFPSCMQTTTWVTHAAKPIKKIAMAAQIQPHPPSLRLFDHRAIS